MEAIQGDLLLIVNSEKVKKLIRYVNLMLDNITLVEY